MKTIKTVTQERNHQVRSKYEEKYNCTIRDAEWLQTNYPDLYNWANYIGKWAYISRVGIICEFKGSVVIKVATEKHIYHINAVKPNGNGNSGNTDKGYLGCTMSNRAPEFGEYWTRGSDLMDGPYDKETWYKIMSDIVACELIKPVI